MIAEAGYPTPRHIGYRVVRCAGLFEMGCYALDVGFFVLRVVARWAFEEAGEFAGEAVPLQLAVSILSFGLRKVEGGMKGSHQEL